MKRTIMWLATLCVFCPVLFAQDAGQRPSSPLPASVVGSQLVVWSDLQKPQPVPQPLPPPQPDPPAKAQPQQPSTGSQDQQPASNQAFTGTIVKASGKYVLKVSESASYQIDDQDKASPYEGKQVKISGRLDAKTNTVHIVSIELLS